MNILKRILLFLSLFLVYVILKEFLELYHYARTLHPVAGYGVLLLIAGFLVYFVILPLLKIFQLPQTYAPTQDFSKVDGLIVERFKKFKKNPLLIDSSVDLATVSEDQKGYDAVIQALEPEAQRIRKIYVTQVFYSTAIAQNGFLDAVLILSACVNMVKELFMLYQGRVYNRDLWKIARMVYYSMAIGGSEGVEYAADEVVSKLFSGGMKGVPFASKILGSLADGFVNATLVARICLITENYCKLVYIQSEKELYPSYKTVIETTRILTSDIIDRILQEVRQMAKESSHHILDTAVNPVKVVMERAVSHLKNEKDLSPKEYAKESFDLVYNPVGLVFQKFTGLFQKNRSPLY